jgi:hypothetical protein
MPKFTFRRLITPHYAAMTILAAAFLPLDIQASPLVVKDVRWGFDGKTVPHQFNILSVLVHNPTRTPFEGKLELFQCAGLNSRTGATHVENVYLVPDGSRWIQFYPFVEDNYTTWRLRWGKAPTDQYDVSRPSHGPPARVLLQTSDDLSSPQSRFQRFPSALFPHSVAGTAGLESLLIDHVPRWEASRREAFRDWVYAGGTVHLLQDHNGQFPHFPADLEVFNTDRAQFQYGAGRIVRHSHTRLTITPEQLTADGFPPLSLDPGAQPTIYNPSQAFFQPMLNALRPHHRWWLVNLVGVAYLLLIGPGLYWGRRFLPDYRVMIGALLLSVAAATALFLVVGRRGHGERSTVYSFTYARALDNRSFRVTQWITAMAAKGSTYTIRHGGTFNTYATASEHEPVYGYIESGAKGHFTVEVPVFSYRSFVHQGKVHGDDLTVKPLEWAADSELRALRLELNPAFPRLIHSACAVYNERIYPLTLSGNQLAATPEPTPDGSPSTTISSMTLAEMTLGYKPTHAAVNFPFAEDDAKPRRSDTTHLRTLLPVAIGWALGGGDSFSYRISGGASTTHQLQLLVLTESPPEFGIAGNALGTEYGCTLYHLPLPTPEQPDRP